MICSSGLLVHACLSKLWGRTKFPLTLSGRPTKSSSSFSALGVQASRQIRRDQAFLYSRGDKLKWCNWESPSKREYTDTLQQIAISQQSGNNAETIVEHKGRRHNSGEPLTTIEKQLQQEWTSWRQKSNNTLFSWTADRPSNRHFNSSTSIRRFLLLFLFVSWRATVAVSTRSKCFLVNISSSTIATSALCRCCYGRSHIFLLIFFVLLFSTLFLFFVGSKTTAERLCPR